MPGSSCASTAAFTWHTVHHGFFPPKPRGPLVQEHQRRAREYQMPSERLPLPHLEMPQPDLALRLLEAPLDAPPHERHAKHLLDGGVLGEVRHEPLRLAGQDAARDKEPYRFSFAGRREPHPTRLPHHRPAIRPVVSRGTSTT